MDGKNKNNKKRGRIKGKKQQKNKKKYSYLQQPRRILGEERKVIKGGSKREHVKWDIKKKWRRKMEGILGEDEEEEENEKDEEEEEEEEGEKDEEEDEDE